jgi:hypothetical protein
MGLAGTWAVGALSSGPLPLGQDPGPGQRLSRGHASSHRRRRFRALLRRCAASPAHPPFNRAIGNVLVDRRRGQARAIPVSSHRRERYDPR